MTLEKVKELMQTRMDYFEQHLSDETITAQLKAYTANLGTVPDDMPKQLSMLHWVIAAIRNSSLLTGRKLCGTSSLTRCRPRNRCG